MIGRSIDFDYFDFESRLIGQESGFGHTEKGRLRHKWIVFGNTTLPVPKAT